MNVAQLMLWAGLALGGAPSPAYPPAPADDGSQIAAPLPMAPSTLPGPPYFEGDHGPDVINVRDHRDGYASDIASPCMSSHAPHGLAAGHEATGARVIDWCALAPYRSRYAPQVPASWWWSWQRDAPWRHGRPW